MSSRPPQPPRLARWLLEAALPEDVREPIVGDLRELFARRSGERGAASAWIWYWGQVLSFSLRFLTERALDRRAASGFSRLDFKLAVRMLVKYPVLSLVGGVAMTVAIAIGAAWYEFARDYVAPEIPLPEGDRIVGIVNQDLETTGTDPRLLHDFVTWRDELRSVEDVGAFRQLDRNLVTADGRAEPIRGAEVTWEAFQLARVPPVVGRPLLEADEAPDAAPVVVLGYGLWMSRFDGDPGAVGRTVQLGEAQATVVGVMPEGFAFPVNFELWAPLRLDPLAHERGAGPSLRVFGRLAPDVSMDQAQAELSALGARAAADHPATNARLRPRVAPYVQAFIGIASDRETRVGNVAFVLLLLVACANVATLVFARTATRAGEIVVRSALGASRGRIVGQLFVEALVLALVSAAAGLLFVQFAMRRGMDLFWSVQGGVELRPFWWNDNLSLGTVLYVGVLAVLGALVVGVLPALKVTRRGEAMRLRQASAGSGLRFGGVWTGVIVTQVALTVIFLPIAFSEMLPVMLSPSMTPAYPIGELLSARVMLDQENDGNRPGWSPDGSLTAPITDPAFRSRLAEFQVELRREIEAEPAVVGVTFVSGYPGSGRSVLVGTGASSADGEADLSALMLAVDHQFTEVIGAQLVAGRAFASSDVTGGGRPVLVNQSFARRVFRGENAVGQLIRSRPEFTAGAEETYEIVGVVEDLGGEIDYSEGHFVLYRLAAPGTIHPLEMAVRLRGAPELFAPRVRAITRSLSPALRVYDVTPLAWLHEAEKRPYHAFLAILGLVGGVAMLLSTVGVHALMSFAVAQRTREIGVRAALGAEPRRIVTDIFSRAVMQLTAGVLVGSIVVLAADYDNLARAIPLVGSVAALMMTVGLLSCVVPAKRALRIQPTEALRGDG